MTKTKTTTKEKINTKEKNIIKKCTLILMIVLIAGAMSGCESEISEKVVSLNGTWREVNIGSVNMYQEAVIYDDTIEIYWVLDDGDTKSLYWAGTYEEPKEAVDVYSWDSKNDYEKTDRSLLASDNETKTITYNNGEVSYSASALGISKTVRLEKVDE